ncbi:MAG TPA: hypothetical protein VLX92_02700 [Kofleriaceae bacterium]|nr:hypothetical protein [Kofleriaceae bacterium]
MQSVVRGVVIAALFGACGASHHDHPDGSMPGDDGGGSAGLTVPWSLTFDVPGDVPGSTFDAEVDEVVFKVLSLEVTGDAGSVQIPKEVDVGWDTTSKPDAIVFPSAPVGLYSKLSIRVDGQLADNSFWINGHATVGGTTYPFKIYDRYFLTMTIDLNTMLSPDGSASIPIQVQLDQALNTLDFSKLDRDDDTITLDNGDFTTMTAFEKALEQAFVTKAPE